MSKFNKPLFTDISGELKNSAASIFCQSPLAVASENSELSFNSAGFGYIPDCGSSYYLSRMPGEFGLYLALTGE